MVDNEMPSDDDKSIRPAQNGAEFSGDTNDSNVGGASSSGTRLLTVGLCLVVFLLSIDRTIVAVAIPRITDHFHSFSDVGWYGSGYLITVCAVQPVFGRIYTVFDTKRTFIIAFSIFEIGSLVCAVTPTSAGLVAGRAVAGAGAGGVLSGSYVIVAQVVPMKFRPAYTAAVSMMFSLGAIVAPLIGAGLTENVSWRWCFYINLPIGLPVAVGMVVFFKPPNTLETVSKTSLRSKIWSLDLLGAALVLGAAVMLFLALQYAADGIAWSSPLVAGLLSGAGTSTIVLAIWLMLRGEKALIMTRILRQRTVCSSCVANISMYASLVIYIYFLAIYLQAVRGRSIVGSAVDLLPLVISTSIFSIVAGVLVTKMGYFAPPAIVGTGIALIGAGLLTVLDESTSTAKWAGFQILVGVGLGLALQQGFFGVQSVLPPSDIPIATSLITFCQSLGGALGVSIGNAVLLNAVRGNQGHLDSEGVDIDLVIAAGATEFQSQVSGQALESVIGAYSDALRDVFITAAVFAGIAVLACCFLEWRKTTDGPSEIERDIDQER